MRIAKLLSGFLESEKSGGLVLVFVTAFSLFLANSGVSESYINFWNTNLGGHTLTLWINDALMAIFFLLIGLELEREIYSGELSNIKNASLPIFAALGGMVMPALIYLVFNPGGKESAGAGIPMATDIAFAVGLLSLLGKRVPVSLKVFLTALAVIDDLGAIIIIAVFYTGSISILYLSFALIVFAALLVMNRLKIHYLLPYLLGGVVMWYFMFNSGVHPTITGVLLAFALPFGKGEEKSASYILQDFLHKPVAFFILPLFALANTCIPLENDLMAGITSASSLGIIFGLFLGKPLGIFLFSWISSKLGLSALPPFLKWKFILGAGILAGIGFTMSIFISILAFDDLNLVNNAKIAILIGSFASAITGLTLLYFSFKKRKVIKPAEG